MFELINSETKFKFTSKFKITGAISLSLVLISLYLAFGHGLNYGVDFRGGAEIQIKFDGDVSSGSIRSVLNKNNVKASVQSIGVAGDNEYLVKIQTDSTQLNQATEKVSAILSASFADKKFEIRKTDIVGPKAGAQLRVSGFQAMMWALIAIMVYIALRFDFKYSPGAIIALLHDVIIVLGIFAVTGKEFTLQTVAALLAVIGYSVNDTVIVYDRVREHENKYAGRKLESHIDNAINETLSRTILTSGTTLFISMAMFFFGGQSIHDFFFAISLGVIIGTYSSIYVAAPVTLIFNRFNFSGKTKSTQVKA